MNSRPDPKRPYKAIAAAVVAAGGALLTFADVLPLWVTIVATVLVAGVATYQVPNPEE